MPRKTTTEPRVNAEGPSDAKVQALRDRELEGAHVRYACRGCPYTHTLTCVWVCRREHVLGDTCA